MILALFLALLFAFFVSVSACSFVRTHGPKYGLVDKPGHRKIHEQPMPTGGGLGIWFGTILPFAIAQLLLMLILAFQGSETILGHWIARLPDSIAIHLDGLMHQSGKLWILLGLASILALLGTLDDRFQLFWKLRLAVQFLVAIAAVWSGFRASLFLDVPLLTGILSVFWIVMLINSFNLLDNMNGLSVGVAIICSGFLAATMLLNPDPSTNRPQLFVGGFLLVLLGAMLGFFVHNNPFRAKMFMGDGGAYFIGFLLACSTLTATYAGYSETSIASRTMIFVPVLILAVPVYDTLSVILIRLREGRSPFEGDKRHFSHRLVARGLTNTQSVLTIYFTTALCAIGSLLLYQVNFYGALLIMSQTALILLLIAILESTK